MLSLFITSDVVNCERRFSSSLSIENLKGKLEPITGISSGSMKLEVYDAKNNFLWVLDESQRSLDSCGVCDLFRIHVINTNPYRIRNEYTDTSLVEKFEITDAEYDKRQDSVRNFKKVNKLGRFSEKNESQDDLFKDEANDIKIGSRFCILDDKEKRGEVKFVGKTNFKSGYWVGVEYDEPIGKHDGKVDDVIYFICKPKHGAFLRPDRIMIGDFPEIGLESDLEEM
jgi:tubulin-folding cofactor B